VNSSPIENHGRCERAEGTTLVPLKVSEMIKLIEDDGWYLIATRGSHRQYKHPVKPGRVTVPGKLSKELPPGTERSILRQAGLTRRAQ
jgi:predicted RNA binding protein YcfA (HicA-like mRNA interferase family)